MRFCIPQFAFLALIIILGMSSMLAGCGKKGPLYLPDQDPKTTLQQR
jgi:predicted small lipoprotein YifL